MYSKVVKQKQTIERYGLKVESGYIWPKAVRLKVKNCKMGQTELLERDRVV
jgi:hypothetical protein